jgi:hypothetical protein
MDWTHFLTLGLATALPVVVQGAGLLRPPWGVLATGLLTLVGNTFHLFRQPPA